MKRSKNLKFTSLLLAVVMLLANFPYTSYYVQATEQENTIDTDTLKIYCDGKLINDKAISMTDKFEFTAVGVSDEASYQWQIMNPAEYSWVDIADKQENTCDVSCALIQSMLEEADCTALRCIADKDGIQYISNSVAVVLYEDIQENAEYTDPSASRPMLFAARAAATDPPEYVTITIHYSLDDQQIFGDYIAKLRYGTSFSASVPSPTYVGYAPYIKIGDGEQSAETVELSYVDLVQSEELTVYYKPAKSDYSVRYFLQNVTDDLYTEDTSRFKQDHGLTGDFPTNIEVDIPGFTALYHVPDVIAADGSTVFHIYYDRNYYLYHFDCNGGYGTDPVYARYGTNLVVPSPIRDGYVFGGWDKMQSDGTYDGVVDVLPSAIGLGNETYQAIWVPADTTVTIIYWNENPDDDGYNYWDSRVVSAISGSQIKYSDIVDSCVMHNSEYITSVTTDVNSATDHPLTNAYDADFSSYWQSSLTNPNNSASKATITIDVKNEAVWDGATNIYVNLAGAYADGGVGKKVTVSMQVKYTSGTSKDISKEVELCDDFSYSVANGGDIDTITLTFSNRKVLSGNTWTTTGANFEYGVAEIELYAHSSFPLPTRPDGDVVPESEFFHYELNEDLTKARNGGDAGLTVAGDGSTVVQLYYKRDLYTLRFYYALKGTDDKFIGVGGSTYGFGGYYGYTGTDLGQLLAEVPADAWGTFNEEPKLNSIADSRNYTKGTEAITSGSYQNYTAYYVEFTAKYGTLIAEEWPVDIFDPVSVPKHSSQSSSEQREYAVFSAWNGEQHVKYSRNSNQTIKGLYYRLDDEIIYETRYNSEYLTDSKGNKLVRYLAFWENGANIKWSKARKWTYNLWFEVLESDLEDYKTQNGGTELNTGTEYTFNGIKLRYKTDKWYYLYNSSECCDNNDDIGSQTPTVVKGYSNIVAKNTASSDTLSAEENAYYVSAHIADFYYDRNNYQLRLYNNGSYINYGSEAYKNVEYGSNLYDEVDSMLGALTIDGYSLDSAHTPPYPSNLEPGAYAFMGWYTSPLFRDGTEVTATSTMLATPMTLYAKWTPISHTVTFSNTYDDMTGDIYINGTHTVDHNDYIYTSYIPTPSSESLGSGTYTFAGWFYMDSTDTKRAFDPATMPVLSDMHLFAEWQSSEVSKYTVKYIYKDGDTETVIADQIEGYAYVGSTKTFTAKAGDELYDGYKNGYYPDAESSSVLMTDDESTNVVTFYYTHKEKVNYTVLYLDSVTKTALKDPVKIETEKSVVTEKYAYISGYLSDAFYKRLVLTSDDDQNVITFYYTQDSAHVRYVERHLIQDLNASTYSEYATIEGIGDIGSDITVDKKDITGFDFEKAETVTSIDGGTEVTQSATPPVTKTLEAGTSLVINFYYTRKQCTATVKYVEYGNTSNELGSATVTGWYGENQEYTGAPASLAKDGTTYTVVGDGKREITFNGIDGQVVYIYYQAKTVTITYIAVCQYAYATGFGSVSLSSETVRNSGMIAGSIPQPGANYRFVGWYTDAACTTEVPSSSYDADAYNADHILKLTAMPESDTIFYALFEPVKAALTITKEVKDDLGNAMTGVTDTFIFTVKGIAGTITKDVELTVAITGNGSVTIADLPIGTYTVTEKTDWSWRYDVIGSGTENVTLQETGTNEVTFQNTPNDKAWLGGEAYKDNIFTGLPAEEP